MYQIEYAPTDASYKIRVVGDPVSGGDNYQWLMVRIQSSTEFYFVRWSSSASQLGKVVGGTFTYFGTPQAGMASGDTIELEISGVNPGTLTLRVNDLARQTASDSDIDPAGKAGVGMGELENGGQGDCANQDDDDFEFFD